MLIILPILGAFSAAWSFFTALKWAAIGSFLLRHWRELLIAALAVLWWLRGNTIEGQRVEIERLEAQNSEYARNEQQFLSAAKANDRAISQCQEINRLNAEAHAHAVADAMAAEARVKAAEREAETRIQGYSDEIEYLRDRDTQCRTLGEPLPDWFVDWLRDD